MSHVLLILMIFISCLPAQEVFINEIRANDEGTDDAEFIELIGPAGFDVSGWSINHINGTGGSVVFSFTFPEGTLIPDSDILLPGGIKTGFLLIKNGNHIVPNAHLDWGTVGLQNGPDGLELTDDSGKRIQALTWNGSGDLSGGDPAWRNIGNDGNDDRSLCAPDSIAESLQAGWDYLNATPGSLNLNQTAEDISLPVQLLSFTASSTDGRVTLQWQTAAEVDNLGFILRRSEAAEGPFNTIASYKTESELEGAGNSSQLRLYKYHDHGVFNGVTYWYQLLDVDFNGQETVQRTISITAGSMTIDAEEGDPGGFPAEFHLYQNNPNPFNPGTQIEFDIPRDINADLSIFDILGRKIITLFTGRIDARSYSVYWNGRDAAGNIVPSGLYIYVLSTPDYHTGRRMVLIR